MIILKIIGIYIIGVIITLVFLHIFGEKIGWGGYDGEKDYSNYDDYDNNAEAFLTFSLIWPIWSIALCFKYGYKILLKISIKIGEIVKEFNK